MKCLWLAFVFIAVALVGCGERTATPVSVAATETAPAALAPELTTPPSDKERRDAPVVSYETYDTTGASELCVNGRLIVAVKMQGDAPVACCGKTYVIFSTDTPGALSDEFLGFLRRKMWEWNDRVELDRKAWFEKFEKTATENRKKGYDIKCPPYDAPAFSVGISFSTPPDVEKEIRETIKALNFRVL